MAEREPVPGLELLVAETPPTVLYLQRLRDGRVAVGTRRQERDGSWRSGELQLLSAPACSDLAGWLAGVVEEDWIALVRERREEPLRTARDLYGGEPGGVERLAHEMLQQIPAHLLARAMILLANAIGPATRERLVQRINQLESGAEEAGLRRELAEENEAFAYTIAAAALFDALAEGEVE